METQDRTELITSVTKDIFLAALTLQRFETKLVKPKPFEHAEELGEAFRTLYLKVSMAVNNDFPQSSASPSGKS